MKDKMDQHLLEEELSSAVDSRFIRYAFMALEDRALPDARDGLKPSQRRVLLSMHDLKLHQGSGTEKSAKICGEISGNYHPHGESVVYPTMCRLVQPWVLRYPLLAGQGNFGNLDGDSPAAMRYTEAKLSPYGERLLEDLNEQVVPYQANYNEKLREPTVLPALLPNLLINGCEGIAVGWATKMVPHNLKEVVAVIKEYIQNPDVTPEKLVKLMPGPDFPTGGKILGKSGILDYYKTGRGALRLEGSWIIENTKQGMQIIVTELPYQSSPDQFCAEIKSLVDADKLSGIADLKNLTSQKTGIRVVIDVQKNANVNLIVNNLLKQTCLRRSLSVNQTVLINGKVIPEASLLQLLKAFVEHRQTVLTNKYTAELDRSQARIHILDGLIGIVDKIEAVVALIIASDSPEAAQDALLAKKYVKSEVQAKAVLAITLRQLTKLESKNLLNERAHLTERVTWLKKILSNEKEIKALIVQEQEELSKRLGDARRTKIISAVEDIAEEDLVKDEQLIVSITADGYVKTVSVDQFKVQNRGGTGSSSVSKADDSEVFEIFETNSKSLVLFFTNHGVVYQRRAWEIPQSSKTGKGLHVSNLLNLGAEETVTNMIGIKNLEEGYLLIVTKQGIIKKTELAEYDTSRKNSGITAISLTDSDQVAFACVTSGNQDVFIVTKQGACVRYAEKIIPIQGRATRGSRGLRLADGDDVAAVVACDASSNPDILVINSKGMGKRTPISYYRRLSSRNVAGCAVMKTKADVVGACAVKEKDSILVLTSAGKCIRLASGAVRESGRVSSGVRVVRLEEEEAVVRLAAISDIS